MVYREKLIAERCEMCPRILQMKLHIATHETQLELLASASVFPEDNTELLQDLLDLIYHLSPEMAARYVINIDNVAEQMPERSIELMEMLLEHIANVEAEMREYASGCLGAVALSGASKRSVIHAIVCDSPDLPQLPYEPATVVRDPIDSGPISDEPNIDLR